MYTPPQAAATVTRPVRASSFLQERRCLLPQGCPGGTRPPRDQMRHFLRYLPLLALAGCATSLSARQERRLASSDLGCERAELGAMARTIAIYTRVVAERVCVLDSTGQCHPRVDGKATAEVRLPQTGNAPPASAIRQELGRRGILARIARPRGPKMYASLGAQPGDDGLLILELGEIGFADDGNAAHVMVRSSGTMDASDWRAAPGGDLVRLGRTVESEDGGLSRRLTSPARACWRIQRSTSSALAD